MVLLVLDDVDCHSQLDALAIKFKWFGPGSRIIITSRDEHILNLAEVKEDKIYQLKELDDEQSLELFSWHAFSQKEPPNKSYEEFSKEVIKLAEGLPLTLEVLGCSFFGIREEAVWKSMLQRLERIPHGEVHKKLKISYEDLEDDEKSILLDAACFFVGQRKEIVTSIWEACGFHSISAIKKLTQRSLLKFTANKLEMHNEIRAMGKGIVYKESPMKLGNRSRLWNYYEILDVLKEHKGTQMIEGILLPSNQSCSSVCICKEDFEMMSNLRILNVNGARYEEDTFPRLPYSLTWFHWRGCPLEISPINFHCKKLVHVDLSESRISQTWTNQPQDEDQPFNNLKVLYLQSCNHLQESPNFSWFPYLERLDLGSCKSMIDLNESIGNLKYLVELCLDDTRIEELPGSICNLSSLKELTLRRCSSFRNLPNLIGNLRSLQVMNLSSCSSLRELPNSFGKLQSLAELDLVECVALNRLPNSINDLEYLVQLSIGGTAIDLNDHDGLLKKVESGLLNLD